MKLKNVLIGAAASLVLAGAVVAQPYGMGPGTTGGYGGGYGMGPGMMGGYGGGYTNDAYAGLDLSSEQRKKIADIHEETSKAMWNLMGAMREQGYRMQGMFWPGPADDSAAHKSYEAMAATQKAMFELQLQARKKIDAVLTKDQHEKLRHYWGNR